MRRENKLTSRKFWFAVATACAIFAGAIVAVFVPAFVVTYPELIAGLLGVLTIYSTGWVAAARFTPKAKRLDPP